MLRAARWSLVCSVLFVPAALGQYYPYGYGSGGALQGKASVINAQGTYTNQMEQARIQREVAEQAKLDTKRKAFDQALYERERAPTYLDDLEKSEAGKVRRALTKVHEGEITTGSVQNTLLPHLYKMSARGIMGPPVKVNQEQLKQINVTTGGKGNVGVVKNPSKVDWPLALRGPKQEKMDALLSTAVAQAAKGKLSQAIYKEMTSLTEEMRSEARTNFQKDKIDSGTYLTIKRFLEPLESGIKMMAEPGANRFLDGTYTARGRTVQELVENMSEQGLIFVPAAPGDEPAYFGLYNAMVAYANGAQSGFTASMPPSAPKRK